MCRPIGAPAFVLMNSPQKNLSLAANVYVCSTRDGSVILDLNRDRYLGVGREASQLLAGAVRGWPSFALTVDACPERALQSATPLYESLLEDGLLMLDSPAIAAAEGVSRVDMRAEFVSIGDEIEVSGRIGFLDVAKFAYAYLTSLYGLRCRRLLTVVDTICLRKRRAENERDLHTRDILRMAALVDRFRRLRAWVFRAEDHCLLHALTLVRFLALYDCFPEWVIGVATQPWGAHSWVQWHRYLLDTNPEKVCRYTPILVV